MQQSVGFPEVLRLYVGLFVVAPLFLWLAVRHWWWALLMCGIWLAPTWSSHRFLNGA